tara:strand:- start:4 stop:183 length:180 start_codon:yes stop_codon:yes gene_type:complete
MKLRGSDNVKKSFTKKDKKGREETWEWEETPELRDFIKRQATNRLHEDIKDANQGQGEK